ncbi:MAG: TetR/AcrR family transcriptional regulator [Actinomycetota bacterium]
MPETAPKRMSREDRRASLLDAAADLLESGRAPLTFETLAETAGVSSTLPYKYFDSVNEIALELYARIVGAVDDATDDLIADPDTDLDAKVRASLHLWCDVLRDEGPLLLRLSDDVAHPGLSRAIEGRRERAVDVWADAIEAQADVAPADARLLAASLTAGSTAILRRWIRDRLDRVATIERFVVMNRAQIEAVASL